MFSFFFLFIRPTPRSTLFPYTTLFRSSAIRQHHFENGYGRDAGSLEGRGLRGTGRGELRDAVGFQRDRKSTRLNSSHTVISYAVFCLKKKKKKRDRSNDHRVSVWWI